MCHAQRHLDITSELLCQLADSFVDPGGEMMRQVVDAVAARNGQQLLRDLALLSVGGAEVLDGFQNLWPSSYQQDTGTG
eukprot:Skav201902  [mRNA]  locus=scaffold550:1061986:1065228:+ [translate_table: standard]